ncbi:MAG: outer membrane lipoprotein chaperone LolA [Marinicella sp.]
MKNTIILLGLFLLPIATAQDSNTEQNVDQKSTDDPLQLLAEVRKDLNGLHANFSQYELTEDNQKIDINIGQVWMQAPAQFRWLYVDPIEQLIVADGEKVWVYDEDLEQVTVKAQSNEMNPIYVIINDELSQLHYQIKHEMQNQGLDWISLTPKEKNEEVQTVWLAVKDNLIVQIKVVNNFGQTLVFDFHDIKRNPEFEPGLFQFIPPEGVDVVQTIGDVDGP